MIKRFINKTSFFVLPVGILYAITAAFYSGAEGDLVRLGYIPNIYSSYRAEYLALQGEKFDRLTQRKNKKYKILNIGDSFSEREFGYNSILADNFSVLHVDRFISENQFQTLINFTNGDFFDEYDIEYVILQMVERNFSANIQNIKLNNKITIRELDSVMLNHKPKSELPANKLFSQTTVEFPLYYFPKFFLTKNYLSNELVYNVEVNLNSLFSTKSNKLLFYYLDPISAKNNNQKENIENLNIVLNTIALKLRQRNIKLIVVPAPDKYDFYYNFIVDKKTFGFEQPLFFELMKTQKKEYLYIDSKAILTLKIKTSPDIYFYDDTHWSPIAARLIAAKIKSEIIAN